MPAPEDQTVRGLRRLVALLMGTSLALAAAVGFLLLRGGSDADLTQLGRLDEEVREAAVRELVSTASNVFDSHQDPDVGRILQPDLVEREYSDTKVSSNSLGMRESEYTLEKPAGTTRVVFLGDSYVMGYGVDADERVGVHLTELMRAGGADESLEILHLGISSWNIRAECAYLRRQLSLLRPDLVIHVVIQNDLSDTKGLRGFGAVAGYSSQVRERANGLVATRAHRQLWERPGLTFLDRALDDESRGRYAEARASIAQLAGAVEAVGARYLLVSAWGKLNPLVHRELTPDLTEGQVAYLSAAFSNDPGTMLGKGNQHWSPAGHRRVALVLYGLVQQRGLLPGFELAARPDADEAVRTIHAPGLAAARAGGFKPAVREQSHREIASELVLPPANALAARHVHGGLHATGDVAPYAALILARGNATELYVEGERLARPELEGRTDVYVDEHLVGSLELSGSEPIAERFPLPADVTEREWVTIRFRSTDYVYRDVARGDCVAFVLKRVALTP